MSLKNNYFISHVFFPTENFYQYIGFKLLEFLDEAHNFFLRKKNQTDPARNRT